MGHSLKYYKFDSISAFKAKHLEVKEILGIPNESTKEYTQGLVITQNDIRAVFEDQYANNLTECAAPELQNKPWEPFPYEIVY